VQLAELETLMAQSELEGVQLRAAAKKGRLVILYAKAGEHLVPFYDEPVRDANVSVDNDFIETTVFGDEAKQYLVGPSTITIRVMR
jgi:hypothetical protein